jgi:CPA2 family monovalent cation:H+ antiporter-2
MHEATQFLTTLTLVLGVAALTTVLFQKLHQPVVLGYMLAGLIIGRHFPFTPVADEATVHTLSELGVILLMFSLGLEFSLRKLFQVAPTAGLIAVIQCSLMIWLGYLAGQFFGWTTIESIYDGAIIAISSTTIIFKAFEEQNIEGKLPKLVFGILIVEDLIGILLLAILTTVSSGASLSARDLLAVVAKLSTFLLALVAIGLLVVPRAFRALVRLNRPETLLVASIGFCFTVSWLAQAVGYSVALGAFIAGALVAESGVEKRVEHLVQPVRDMFAAIFFVSVGMLIDPQLIIEHWPEVVAMTVIVIVGKIVGVTLGSFLAGFGIRTSLAAGMSLAQIGEFSFIIASVGLAYHSTREFLYPIAVAVSAITTLTTPWLIRAAGPVSAFVDRKLPRSLQTFAALYGTWLERLRTTPHEPSLGQRIRRLVGLLLLDSIVLAVLVIGASLSMETIPAWVQTYTGGEGSLAKLIVVGGCILLSAPLCLGIARCARRLGLLLATEALPAAKPNKLDMAAAPRQALVAVLQVAVVLLVGGPLVALTQPFLPPFGGAILLLGVLATLGISFWHTAADLQGHVRAGAQLVAEVLSKQASSSGSADIVNSQALLEELLPGMGTPMAVRLRPESEAIGRTLVELNLRGRTGATVLAIARGNQGMLPTGKEVLEPGDVLALAGTHDAIDAAREIL